MKNIWLAVLCTLIGIIGIATLSCNNLMNRVIPADLPEKSVQYVADACDFTLPINIYGFTSLYDAQRLESQVVFTYEARKREFQRMLEDNEFEFDAAAGPLRLSISESEQFKTQMIGDETTPFSIVGMLSFLGIGTGGMLFGKNKLQRKGDYTPEQHDIDVETAYRAGREDAVSELAALSKEKKEKESV